MNLKQLSVFVGSLSASLALAAADTPIPAAIGAAVANTSRPAADTERDVNRKPAQVLTFAGIKPGDKVGELIPGRNYFTRILCQVVGSGGHVYTIDLLRPNRPPPAPPAPPTDSSCTNVTASRVPGTEFALPASLDLIWTSENYHDLHNPGFGVPDMKTFNKAIFDALKPGGVYMVEDHAAAAGSGTRDTNTLHRIDPATAIAEVTSVGFVLESQSNVLANPDDKHTEGVLQLPGKTDKFLLKFRKPAR